MFVFVGTAFALRLAASCKALFLVWLLAGIAFYAVVRGPGTISLWLIWGTGVFVALGDRIRNVPYPVLAVVGGLAGALLMLSPGVLARLTGQNVHYAPFAVRDLAWPGVAFAVAAPTVALYRFFLDKAR